MGRQVDVVSGLQMPMIDKKLAAVLQDATVSMLLSSLAANRRLANRLQAEGLVTFAEGSGEGMQECDRVQLNTLRGAAGAGRAQRAQADGQSGHAQACEAPAWQHHRLLTISVSWGIHWIHAPQTCEGSAWQC